MSSNPQIYDIVIIGAGPAGLTFARELAKSSPNLKILLIDGQTKEHSKPCGGLLAPDAQKVLAQFDLTLPKDILADPQIFTVETIDLVAQSKRYYQRHYLNMDRYRFDRWLVSLVPQSVEILSARMKRIERKGELFCISHTGGSILARFVVGADGACSPTRQTLGKSMPYSYVSIQEWYKSTASPLPYYSCIFDSKTSDSCSWTIHKDGYMIYGGAFPKRDCRALFEEQKSRLEAFTGTTLGAPERVEACLVNSPRKPSEFCLGGDGIFLIGEAAGFISSSSFEGISSAMISGKKLAEAFSLSSERLLAKSILKTYRRKTASLRAKLCTKMLKRKILCSPTLRRLIMASKIASVKVEYNERGIKSMIDIKVVKSVVIGHAVADAAGVPVEFRSREVLDHNPVTDLREYGTYNQPRGTWSDDTSMSLCALDSLSSGELDYDDVMVKFGEWLIEAKYTATDVCFDVGITCKDAIIDYHAHHLSTSECGQRSEYSNGNGSLMRIHPFVLYLYAKDGKLTPEGLDVIAYASALTHAHPRSCLGCQIYAFVLTSLLERADKASINKGLLLAKEALGSNPEFVHYEDLNESLTHAPRSQIKSGGYIVDSLKAALWCLATTDSYEQCVLRAVNLGNDTDTIAAIAGGLAGALYGYDNIPKHWKDSLLRVDYITEMCDTATTNWNKAFN